MLFLTGKYRLINNLIRSILCILSSILDGLKVTGDENFRQRIHRQLRQLNRAVQVIPYLV